MKLEFLILVMLVALNSANAQTSLSDLINKRHQDSLSRRFYQKYQLPSNRPSYNGFSLIELKVVEVDSTHSPFSDDSGSIWGYCGNVEGGIKNLLQNKILHSTSHIKFLNKPYKKRYVLFYGTGLYMNGQGVGDSISNCYLGHGHIRGRDIVLDMMSNEFRFEVKQIEDSLEVMELRIIDSAKLNIFLTPYAQRFMPGSGIKNPNTGEYRSVRSYLWPITKFASKAYNKTVYDETNTDESKSRYDFTIPGGLMDSPNKYDEFNNYLKQNLGLTLIKTKRLEKIYTIEFKKE